MACQRSLRFPAELSSGPDLTHEVVDGLPARHSLGELFHNPSENGERISMDGCSPSQTHTPPHIALEILISLFNR